MATRLMLNTYFELMFKVVMVPKYDSINHKWNFIIPNILSAELYNNLGIKNLSSNYNKYLDKEIMIYIRYFSQGSPFKN